MSSTIEKYFQTAFEDKLIVKMPEREDDNLTSATRLLEKRREKAEVEQALEALKEEFQMKMESLQQRREEVERKEMQLKESLLKFDKFLKENDSKRIRAIKKATVEREMKKVKDKEIEKLQMELEVLTSQRDRLHRRLERNAIYHRFLDRVLETAEDFHEVREVIARYDTLNATHEDLLLADQVTQTKIEEEKRSLILYTEAKNNEILNFNNELSNLQTRFDKAQLSSVRWESKWTHIKTTAATKTLLLGRVKMAAHNLYQVVKRHQRSRREEDSDTEDTNEQLLQVQQYIQDLTQIVTDIRRQDVQLVSNVGSSTT